MNLVLKEVVSIIKPLQKYVYEDNELDIKMASVESEINLLKELLLDTQADVVRLQKAKARKTRKKK